MNLSRYAAQGQTLVQELSYEFAEDDLIEDARQRLKDTELNDWFKWRDDNLELVMDFLKASPSNRDRYKKFKIEERSLLVLATLQCAMEGAAFLDEVNMATLEPGRSYRAMLHSAALAHHYMIRADIPYWPYTNDGRISNTGFWDDDAPDDDEL